MAKSLRSKWRRKCRAVKRERYDKKELERLQKTLVNDPCNKAKDVDMKDIAAIVTVVDKSTIQTRSRTKKVPANQISSSDEMETNTKERIFNPRTMKDQHGTYPIWMHQRRIHKRKKTGSKGKSKKKSKS